MEFNSFLFPAPRVNQIIKQNVIQQDDLIYIPKKNNKQKNCMSSFGNKQLKQKNYIPCKMIYFQQKKQFSDKIMISFHGNAEDLLQPNTLMALISKNLKVNALLVEYPGYGFYNGKCNAKNIESDAQDIYDFLIQNKVQPNNIMVFGRSIGSGPAFYLASNNQIGILLTMSPYTNIKEAAKFLVGALLSKIVKQRFRNDDRMQQIQSPIFIIHGIKDNIIPFSHSQQLVKLSVSKNLGFIFPKNMTHNEFELYQDILEPIFNFLRKIDYKINFTNQNQYEFFQESRKQELIENQDSLKKCQSLNEIQIK